LAYMMDRMNNRLKSFTEYNIVPLIPNCLLVGRTSTSAWAGSQGDADYLVEDYPKRLRYCQELLQFWRREFEKQVFFHLLPYQKYKDTKRHANLQVGDVCLLTYPGKIQETSRYCRVNAVHPDQDGVVRNITISLRSRNAREKLILYKARKPMQMLVGVKRLVLICPQEEVQGSVGNSDSDVNLGVKESVADIHDVQVATLEDNAVEDDKIGSDDEVTVKKVVVSVVLGAEEIEDSISCVVGKKNIVAKMIELQRYSK
jgi:hypothetical protein